MAPWRQSFGATGRENQARLAAAPAWPDSAGRGQRGPRGPFAHRIGATGAGPERASLTEPPARCTTGREMPASPSSGAQRPRVGAALGVFYFCSLGALGIQSPYLPLWLEAHGLRGARMSAVAALVPAL